jgi:hypothetical protein
MNRNIAANELPKRNITVAHPDGKAIWAVDKIIHVDRETQADPTRNFHRSSESRVIASDYPYDLTRGRPENPAFNYGFFRPNPLVFRPEAWNHGEHAPSPTRVRASEQTPKGISIASSIFGASTFTVWKRRSSAASFSM